MTQNDDGGAGVRAAERQRFLAGAVRLLAGSLEYEATLAHVARLAVPEFADYALVDLIEGGAVRRVAALHRREAGEALLRELGERYPPTLEGYGAPRVYRDGESALAVEIDEGQLRAAAADEAHLALLRALAPRAAIMAPMRARGQVVGVITFGVGEGGRGYGPEDLALAEEVARHVALAVDNARLYAAERAARQRAERVADRAARLQRVTAALSATLTTAQAAAVVIEQCAGALGAAAGVVGLVEQGGASLAVIHAVGVAPGALDGWERMPLGGALPLADAALAEGPRFFEGPGELLAAYPSLASAPLASRAVATAPFRIEGRALGALYLGFAEPRAFDADDRAFLETLAHQCAQALERARLYALEREARAQAEAARARDAALARRATFLAELSQQFADALDDAHILASLTRRSVPLLGDACIVYQLAGEDALRRTALAHADPEAERQLAAAQRFEIPLDSDLPVTRAVRGGATEWSAVITGELVRAVHDDEEYQEVIRRFAPRAYICAPLVARGKVLGAMAFIITESDRSHTAEDVRLAEEVARRAAIAMDNARLYQEAQQAIAVRDQFMSVAAHELRTPLTTLLGNAQLLERRAQREESLSARNQRSLRVIVEQAVRLSRMIFALLDVTRIETGRLTIERGVVDLAALAERVLAEAQPMLARHRVAWSPPGAPALVAGDSLRLEQVLHNLISNAARYSPEGSLITLRVAAGAGEVCLEVADEGIGIPPEDLPSIFQRFYRATNADPRHASGMGIGLFVVREIVALHGGRIDVASAPGQGSTFAVWLPAAQA